MDERVQAVFGRSVVDLLAKHGFRRIGGTDEEGWFTRAFSNGTLGIRLLYHLRDKDISLMPLDQPGLHYSVSSVMRYFGRPDSAGASLEDQANFVDQHYGRIASMFARRDGGADLRGLIRSIREFNVENFHLDEPTDPR